MREEEPVVLTKNAYGRLVLMSRNYFEKMQAMARLYAKLDEAEKLSEAGDRGISHKEMMRRIRARIRKKVQRNIACGLSVSVQFAINGCWCIYYCISPNPIGLANGPGNTLAI